MMRMLLAAAALAAVPATAKSNGFDAMRWQNRVVVLSAADPASPKLAEQERLLLADAAGLREREVVVLVLAGDEVRVAFGRAPSLGSSQSIRDRLGLSGKQDFVAVLIGKDGGVKWSAEVPTPASELDAVIDAMPMRRSGQG